MKECCHGTKGCEGQGDKHWCAERPVPHRLESLERRIVVLEQAAHDHGDVAGRPIKTASVSGEAGSSDGKLTDADAKAMLGKLQAHFGEPVMPAGQYCAALNLWASALRDKAQRLASDPSATDATHLEDIKTATRFADDVSHVFMQITKSNLLHRLIYQGESLRTEMCPIHKGRWSGCVWDDKPCACQGVQGGGFGSNVTGWLPDPGAGGSPRT